VATGNYIPLIHAAQGTLKFATSAVTFDETSLLSSKTFAQTIIQCKNISITPPKGEVEKVDLLGVETITVGANNLGGTWQNAVFDEKAWSEATMTCTLILTADQTNQPDFMQLVAQPMSPTGGKRFTFGSSDTNEGRIKVGAILLTLNNNSEQMDIVLLNPIVNAGDIKPTDMTGHFEMDFEAKVLPKGFAIDIKD